jgi:MYXO-CTERM domain-containing protein
MQRTTKISVLVLAGALALPAISFAQADDSAVDRDQSVVRDVDRDNDNYGWLGLLGLAGLLGLKRRDRETERDHARTRPAH